MKAITQDRYGAPDEVLELRDIATPAINDYEVLVRVRAASVNPADGHYVSGLPYVMRLAGFGLRTPKNQIPGSDIAGQVEAVGKNVTRFGADDEVFAYVNTTGFAEYTRVPEGNLCRTPANLTFEQAAAVPLAAMTALQGLRDVGKIQPGQNVLIIGASGGVGTFAVQLAKAFETHVTGVCSTRNVEMVRSLGADDVIDYTHEDVTGTGQKYDLILQVAGTAPPSSCRRALTPTGTLVQSSGDSDGNWLGPVDRIIAGAVLSRFVSQRIGSFVMKQCGEDLEFLKTLIENGKVTPVIDRTYPLSEVPGAIRYLEHDHAQGKVVITI